MSRIILFAISFLLLASGTIPAGAQPRLSDAGSITSGSVTLRGTFNPRINTGGRSWREGNLKIGIVLSGGGSRGFAQIGVLKVLEEAGVPIYAVVGTSMGGMLGGLYANGYSAAELDSIARTTNWENLLGIGDEAQRNELFIDQKIENDRSLLTLRLEGLKPVLPEAVSTGSRMTQFIENLVWGGLYHGGGSFDSLRYRYRAVATDLVQGRAVILDSGNLALAMRASATVPLRFSPVPLDSMLLVDGGLLMNIPVEPAHALGCDFVIVVNTTSPLQGADQLNTPWNVADQVVTLMMKRQNHEGLDAADFVITPDLTDVSGTDFSSVAATIDSGEAMARRHLAPLLDAIRKRGGGESLLRNLGIDCTDRQLLAQLGYAGNPVTIDLRDLQQRLDAVGRGGGYRDLTARVDYHEGGARFKISGTRAPDVDSVALHGFDLVERDLIEPHYAALAHAPLDFDSLRIANERAIRAARRRGYSFFRIDSASYDEKSRRLDVHVDEGVIKAIRFVGLEHCAEFVVARELEFHAGDIFLGEEAGRAVNRLMRTGYFRHVHIDAMPLREGGLEAVVTVKERSSSVLRISASVDSERYTQLGMEVAEENLFGHGTHLGFRFWGGLRDRNAVLDFGANRIYGTYWTFGLKGYGGFRNVNSFERIVDPIAGEISRNIIGEYREMRVGGKVRFGRQMERFGLFTVEGRYERQGTRDLTISASDARWRDVATLKFGARFDTQDRFPFASDGTVVDLSYETSQQIFGADESFVKLSADAELFTTVAARHTIHPRFRLGFGDVTLPLLEQFSLGGQRSMFGLREDERRGRQLLLGSLEYRYLLPIKLYFDTYISLRYDLGSTWLAPSEIRMADFEHGVGFNIGLDTPLGPANFSLGRSFTLNRPPAVNLLNLGPVVAYFSFGYRFD